MTTALKQKSLPAHTSCDSRDVYCSSVLPIKDDFKCSFKTLKLFVINSRSVCNKIDELRAYASLWKPHIITITESWAKSSVDDSFFAIQGYSLFRRDRLVHMGGGVLLYVHLSLSCMEILRQELSCFEDSVACKIFLPDDSSLTLAAFYRSPNSSDYNNHSLVKAISHVMRFDSTYHLLTGDFNFPDINWDSYYCPPSLDYFMDVVNEYNLDQLVTSPTRENAILDLFFTDNAALVNEVSVREPLGQSDHNIVVVQLAIPSFSGVQSSSKARFNYSLADWDKYRCNLINFNILSSLNVIPESPDSIEDSWSIIKHAVLESANQSIPYCAKRSKVFSLSKNPEVRRALFKKYRTYKKYKHSSNEIHKNIIREAQLQAKRAIRRAKIYDENVVASQAAKSPKLFWNHVRRRLKSPAVVTSLQKSDGSFTQNDSDTATVLNNFFVSVFTAETDTGRPPLTSDRPVCRLASFEITSSDVCTAVQRVNRNSSPGLDGISNRLIFEGRSTLIPVLVNFFNLLLQIGDMPNEWRFSNIVPIHKGGSYSSPSNYRPISVTSSVCKILERIIHCKILCYMNVNGLLSSSQHGFLPRRSCLTAHLEFLHDITALLDSGTCVDVVYFDFIKAFDSVPHGRLIDKLKSYGIDGSLLLWIKNFLTNRHQRVALRNEVSQWLPVLSGVPQGSVLGPLLFVLYVDDIDSSLKCPVKKYADDIKIFASVSDGSLQSSINNIFSWSAKWLLRIHPTKCCVLHLGRKNPKTEYLLDGALITQTDTVKDLGVIIDDKLKWSPHCLRVSKRAHRILTLMYKTFLSRNPDVLLKIYKSHVRPLLEYVSSVWSPYLKRDIDVIEKVQVRFTRFFPHLRKLPYRDRLSVLGIQSLQARRLFNDLITVYKVVHNHIDTPFHGMFIFSSSIHRTRGHPYKLYIPDVKLNCRKEFFSSRVVPSWNSLPACIVTQPSVRSFKILLKEHLFSQIA